MSAMKEALQDAYTDVEKSVGYVDAGVGELMDKVKAGNEEERSQAEVKADRKRVEAEDKAQARKVEHHAQNAPYLKDVEGKPFT